MSERSWRDAIIRVLRESGTPLHYAEITEQVLSRGYYRTDGATPSATVNATIATSIKHEPAQTPFVRVAKGTFALRSEAQGGSKGPKGVTGPERPSIEDLPSSIIRAFGMYWQRDLVVWRNDPRLYGKQQLLAKAVDFGKQKGIYILYDRHRVIYVGRSTDRPLGKRLYEHTLDRLSGRWDRFSWFGLLDVNPDGTLREPRFDLLADLIVNSLEALLIEVLEPPQNRKRGDDLAAIEYVQEVDPELREREIQATLRSIEQKLRGGS